MLGTGTGVPPIFTTQSINLWSMESRHSFLETIKSILWLIIILELIVHPSIKA
jgi:hypothetical protein